MIDMNFDQFQSLLHLYGGYASAVDEENWDKWIDFFVDDCVYKIQARENFDAGLPLCTLAFNSKGMLKDRIYAITDTLYHDPYYQRHVVSVPRIVSVGKNIIHSEANYSVFRTKADQLTEVFNVGRYIDEVHVTDDGMKFRSRHCVFDTEMIPNSLIYPI